jgi:putative oxidoreductase
MDGVWGSTRPIDRFAVQKEHTMDSLARGIDRSLALGLLVLRLTLGLFLTLWSLEKFILPEATVRIAQNFYGLGLPAAAPMLIGAAELALSIALLFGLYRQISYGLALLIHTVTVIVSWRQLLDPWGLAKVGTHIWISTIPTWGGFVCLYLARRHDAFSLDVWRGDRPEKHPEFGHP